MPKSRARQKVRYELDSRNRLVIQGRTRRVIEGYFEGENNQLIYRAVSSAAAESIRFKGRWSLTRRHEFCYRVEEAQDVSGAGKFSFAAEVVNADKSGIAFSLLSRSSGGKSYLRIIKLEGAWSADEFNRLKFCVEKESANAGELVFLVSWEINNNLEIIYRYTKDDFRGKRRQESSFTLKGDWQVNGRHKVSFLVDGDSRSRLDFKAEIGSPSLIGKAGELRYRIGAGYSFAPPRRLILSGSWKLNRDLSLSFEVKYKNGRTYINSFQIIRAFDNGGKISLFLSNRETKVEEFGLVFEREFFRGAKWFLKLCGNGIWAGGVIPF